jgi:phosphoribosyl-ATP pyrophosphohydrolase/phosphoribosyl-AMP cyclohydrolase
MSTELPLKLDEHGLLPVVVQDHLTGEVRMVAFANAEAVARTLETGRATFWSRSRGELWEKGKSSGNAIEVHQVLVDCDADCLVYSGEPSGPSCHTGAASCFFQAVEGAAIQPAAERAQTILATLEAVLESRKRSTGKASYTKSLYDAGPTAIGAKIREESAELATALLGESDERVVSEAADTLYHVLVGLRWRAIPFRRVLAELARRLGTSGHAEKARRSPHQGQP